MKKTIVKRAMKFALGRGAGKVEEVLSKHVRHGAGVIGGALLSQGWIEADEVQLITGAAMSIAAVVWSVARTFLSRKIQEL